MTVSPFSVPIGHVNAGQLLTGGPITAGASTEVDLFISMDLPNGLADWSSASYAGNTVTITWLQDAADGNGFQIMAQGGPYTAPTPFIPRGNLVWTPPNPNAQLEAQVVFGRTTQAGCHGTITTLP